MPDEPDDLPHGRALLLHRLITLPPDREAGEMNTRFRLELDALRVESFDTAPPGRGGGTVRGHEYDAFESQAVEAVVRTDVRVDCGSWIDACPSRAGTCDTCKESCLGTCSTCDAEACGTQYPSCPTGPVCAA